MLHIAEQLLYVIVYVIVTQYNIQLFRLMQNSCCCARIITDRDVTNLKIVSYLLMIFRVKVTAGFLRIRQFLSNVCRCCGYILCPFHRRLFKCVTADSRMIVYGGCNAVNCLTELTKLLGDVEYG